MKIRWKKCLSLFTDPHFLSYPTDKVVFIILLIQIVFLILLIHIVCLIQLTPHPTPNPAVKGRIEFVYLQCKYN